MEGVSQHWEKATARNKTQCSPVFRETWKKAKPSRGGVLVSVSVSFRDFFPFQEKRWATGLHTAAAGTRRRDRNSSARYNKAWCALAPAAANPSPTPSTPKREAARMRASSVAGPCVTISPREAIRVLSTWRPSSPCAWRCGDRCRGSSSPDSWPPWSACGRSPPCPASAEENRRWVLVSGSAFGWTKQKWIFYSPSHVTQSWRRLWMYLLIKHILWVLIIWCTCTSSSVTHVGFRAETRHFAFLYIYIYKLNRFHSPVHPYAVLHFVNSSAARLTGTLQGKNQEQVRPLLS